MPLQEQEIYILSLTSKNIHLRSCPGQPVGCGFYLCIYLLESIVWYQTCPRRTYSVMQMLFLTVSLWTAGSWLNQILLFRLVKCEGIKCFIQILQLRIPRELKEKSRDVAGWKILVWLIQTFMWALEMR